MSYTQVSYQEALKYMEEDDMNVLAIRNFTSEDSGAPYPYYEIDGGADSLLDLELEECDNFNELEFYKYNHLEYIKEINKIYQQSRINNRKVINELQDHLRDFYEEREYQYPMGFDTTTIRNLKQNEYYNFIIEDMSDIYLGLPNWIYSMSEMRKDFKKNKKIVFVDY